ncbi:hypothetical protein ADL19_05905 [Streptomyces purpurogeneiscleroticus]|nr:hypothetical protein ADL19_05905 [Streptomyces purpurogeneiscleroticus]
MGEAQIAALYDLPTERRDLVRHYTLSASDRAAVRRCRGDHNRLGTALMLCTLRYPGRALRAGECPPPALIDFVASQLDIDPAAFDGSAAAERSRQRHAITCQAHLGLRPFGRRAAAELSAVLLAPALDNDRLITLADLMLRSCRERRIVLPSPAALERLCADLRHRARREVHRRLCHGLSAEHRRGLDGLTQLREDTGQTWLTWVRQMPQAAKPASMLGLIARLSHISSLGIEAGRGRGIHAERVAQIASEAARVTVQHIAGYARQRRHATLVATVLDLQASLTDQVIALFDRMIGALFRSAEGRQARAFQADARAINDKVRLYARVGGAVIAAHTGQKDAFAAITAVIPWERFCASVAEAEVLARPEAFDAYEKIGAHYTAVRRWSPAFLDALGFEGIPAVAPLLRAVAVLREANRTGSARLPASAPTGFVKGRWAAYVLSGGGIDRRHYELCVLSELRARVLAGEVWVRGSRQHRSFEERLVSPATRQAMQDAGTLTAEPDFDRFIEGRQALLDRRLAEIDTRAGAGLLRDVTLARGVLKVAPLMKSTPPEAEALAGRLYAMLPRIRITDLLAEVADWTGFADCFTHLQTGVPAADTRTVLAGVLADGLNLGLTRMAEACSIASLGQLAWTSDWHIREETYGLALRRLVDRQQREPFAATFGPGIASSSDGQFFPAARQGRAAGRRNAHYGPEPGFKVYTHLSDRYGPFFTKTIAATASEALHVLDALLHHGSEVTVRRHHTDGGGDTEHVFALCSLLGFQFAPRIPDLAKRRLYGFGKPADHPTLAPLIGGRINVALIRAHWPDILRIVASLRAGTVTASVIMRQLAAHPRQNGIATALREIGRMERTLFMLDWIEDPELRRSTGHELNKGETRNSLARAVFLHRLGEIRDRTYENQQHRASGLNLVVTAIVLWNTRYLERALARLRGDEFVPAHLLAHLSPLGWEHINLTGDYIWTPASEVTETTVGSRPLRVAPTPHLKAA